VVNDVLVFLLWRDCGCLSLEEVGLCMCYYEFMVIFDFDFEECIVVLSFDKFLIRMLVWRRLCRWLLRWVILRILMV